MLTSLAVVPDEPVILPDPRTDPPGFIAALKHLYEDRFHVICPPAEVCFSGRRARSRLGYYEVGCHRITINNEGMTDYCLRSTLVHELAHYIQYVCVLEEGGVVRSGPGASHGEVFHIQHQRLCGLAIAAGMLPSLTDIDDVLRDTVNRIQSFRKTAGEAIIQTGEQLARARERCLALGEQFEVFLRDFVAFDRTTAYDYIRAYKMDMPPILNFTTMRFLMRIKDATIRKKAIADAVRGVALIVLRVRYQTPKADTQENEIMTLLRKRKELQLRLDEIEARLFSLRSGGARTVGLTATGEPRVGQILHGLEQKGGAND